jgi:uncharacterized protein (TIGR00290 family)
MSNSQKILCSWSGGKDSCFALMLAIENGYVPTVLLNVLNEEGKISRSHGIPAAILQAQANAMQLPIHLVAASWQTYEQQFTNALKTLRAEYSISAAVFGDIDLQAHRDWEEKVCDHAGLIAVLPLWKKDRKALVLQMLDAGIKTMIVSCNETIGKDFLGQYLTPKLIDTLEALGIDACGENGEFHTLVTDCSLFKHPISVDVVAKLHHEGYWFSELVMA